MSLSKPVPQVTLEVMMKRNKEEAEDLLRKAQKLIAENRFIETKMEEVLLSVPPPPSRVSGTAPTMAAGMPVITMKASSPPPSALMAPPSRPDPMGGLLHAADALVRSWKRRHKKNFSQLETDLMTALEKTNAA